MEKDKQTIRKVEKLIREYQQDKAKGQEQVSPLYYIVAHLK